LEADSVTASLAIAIAKLDLHELPSSEANLFHSYADLRDAVHAEMMTIRKAIILEPARKMRSPNTGGFVPVFG